MSTIYDELADLDVTVNNGTPQLDLHPQLHNDTDAILSAVVASLAKSVEWFDTDGTIGTDATEAFTLALASGGVVKLKANTTYTITSTLVPDTDHTWIVGDGESSVIRMMGDAFNLFETDGLDGLHLKDFRIDGTGLNAPRLGSLSANALNGATSISLFNTHTLQSGDVVYAGNPDTPWVGYQTVTLSNVTSTGATVSPAILSSAPTATGFGANTVVATVANGQGGHALKMQDGSGLTLEGVTIDGVLRHGLWLINVSDVRVSACTFEHLGDALVAQDPYSAFNFGIGGYGVGRLKVLGSTFRDIIGRRAAGIELRVKVNQADTADEADILIEGCHFLNLGSTGIARANNGAAINLVCAENSVRFDRIVILGNTFDRITDGFVWILSPTGSVTVQGNTGTNSRHGPFYEVDAPVKAIIGNTALGASSTEGYAGIWARCSPGTGDFATAGQGVDDYSTTIIGNVIKGMRGAVGVGIYVFGGPQVPATGSREFVIVGNTIAECNQDGIQVDLGDGDYIISNNVIRDVNAGSLASTTLAADVTFVEGATATIQVTSTAYFVAGMFVNIAADTVNRQILEVVDGTHLLMEECPTGGAAGFSSGDAVFNPFPGAGGIYLNGDANEGSIGDSVVRVSDLTGLNWADGDSLGMANESGLTISGTPAASANGTYLVTLSAPLAAAHQHGETIVNTTQANSASFAALHTHQNVDVSHNRVKAGALGTTRYGLVLRNVIGPIHQAHNNYNGCTLGPFSITGYPKLYTYNPANTAHAGWQTDQSLSLETHLRDWGYRTQTASSARTTSAMTAASTISFTMEAVPTDWAVGDFLWIEAIAQTVAAGDLVNGEVAKIDDITGTTITIHSAVLFDHASGVRVYKAAYNPKLRVWGADSNNQSQGHYATLGYDENNLLMKLLFAASGHVPDAHARIEVQGANSNLQLVANNQIAELTGGGVFRPRLGHTNDLGDANHVWKNVYAESVVLLLKAGAPSDSDFTTPTNGQMALDTTNHRLYIRDGGSWRYAALT